MSGPQYEAVDVHASAAKSTVSDAMLSEIRYPKLPLCARQQIAGIVDSQKLRAVAAICCAGGLAAVALQIALPSQLGFRPLVSVGIVLIILGCILAAYEFYFLWLPKMHRQWRDSKKQRRKR
jgi:hypothetical protein